MSEMLAQRAARLAAALPRNRSNDEIDEVLVELAAANAQLERERDALRDEWREIAAGLTTEEPEVGALWPMVAEVSGSLAAVRLHFKNEVAAHNATKGERDAAVLRAAEAVVAVNKFDRERMAEGRMRYSMEKERNAANAARLAAEGERDRLREAIQPLVRIAEAYWRNELDEGRPASCRPIEQIELVATGGGRRLLTVADCIEAESAFTPAPEPNDGE